MHTFRLIPFFAAGWWTIQLQFNLPEASGFLAISIPCLTFWILIVEIECMEALQYPLSYHMSKEAALFITFFV